MKLIVIIAALYFFHSGGMRMKLPLDDDDEYINQECAVENVKREYSTNIGSADYCANRCTGEVNCSAFELMQESPGSFRCYLWKEPVDQITTASAQYWTCYIRKATNPSSRGDPHSQNMLGQHFDIRRPGNYSFLRLPRGGDEQQMNLNVQAHVTSRGQLCSGKLYITGLEIAGRWLSTVGGRIELYTETEMFNSPETVGLKAGNSRNMSLQEFVAQFPKTMLSISRYSPQSPTEISKHVNTLMMQFHLGPTGTVKIGWSHEKLADGFTNWLWLSASGLGDPKEAGGLLGADDHMAVQKPPDQCKGKPEFHKTSPALQSWAWVDP